MVIALFGDQWVDSIEPTQILTVYAFAVTVGIPAGTAYKATGRAGVLLNLGVARLTLVVVALLLFVDLGISAVAASQAAVAGLASLVGLWLASRLLDVRLAQIVESIWPAFAGGLLMAVPMLLIERFVEAPWPALIAGGLAGGATYAAFLWLVVPDTVRFLKEKWRPTTPHRAEDITLTRETDVIA